MSNQRNLPFPIGLVSSSLFVRFLQSCKYRRTSKYEFTGCPRNISISSSLRSFKCCLTSFENRSNSDEADGTESCKYSSKIELKDCSSRMKSVMWVKAANIWASESERIEMKRGKEHKNKPNRGAIIIASGVKSAAFNRNFETCKTS